MDCLQTNQIGWGTPAVDAEPSDVAINVRRRQRGAGRGGHLREGRAYDAEVLIDLAINPFDALVPDMVTLARAAEKGGAGCVWVADHFSGAVVGRSWSRDPFVCLGAIAAVTERVEVGILVANMVNRHPAQLASAVNSLQSIAPGRVRLGVGSGAAPGSRFAIEHDAIGTSLGDVDVRRGRLVDTIAALQAIWHGHEDFDAERSGPEAGFFGLSSVVDASSCPPLIVGASSWPTVEVALARADGVNLRRTAALPELLARIELQRPDGFEVSVLDWFNDVADNPNRIDEYAASGVDRLVLGISPPHDAGRLDRLDLAPR
jgi:alkanesulfonate monooxygenase SsuD/methylene tetrahydromethanopterin reductase-like flavin-dependent oxidoreductase (luciferase family)